uniref:MGAT4 conserved region domain-containing protein n=1 Tax=Aotus nancymaae TaxID=37293 RepID=A0A2K5D593_AOTNA
MGKVDHALLTNFASNLSDYFLLLEDHIHCAPKFVGAISLALSAWKELPWVILEFAHLSISGKVFRTSDLSHLTKDTSTHLFLSEFHLLLAQNVPIHFSPSVFHHTADYSKDRVFGESDNPAATVLTDMVSILAMIPQYAYTLNEEGYSTLDPLKGNYLTVILDRPQRVTQIAVLTGSDKEGRYQLQQGQVEPGYDPQEDPRGCTRCALLGPLVGGYLDQIVFSEKESVEELSCIRLLVLASQESWLLIRQIKVWTEPEEEEK